MLGAAVCGGVADALQFLLDGLGIENAYAVGIANSLGSTGGHAWNIIQLEGGYYQVDATWDLGRKLDLYDGEFVTKYEYGAKYFLLSDSSMSKSRTWDKSGYPECPKDYPFNQANTISYEINGSPAKNNRVYKNGKGWYCIYSDSTIPSELYINENCTLAKTIQDGETYWCRDIKRGMISGKIVNGYWVEGEGNPPKRPATVPPLSIDLVGMNFEDAVKTLNDLGLWENDTDNSYSYSVGYKLNLDENQHNKVFNYSKTSHTSQGKLAVNYYPKNAMTTENRLCFQATRK